MSVSKTKLTKLISAGLFAIVGMALIVGCGSGSSTVKIGFLADYSGPLAEFGPEIEKGVKLAVKQVNAAGGVNGRTLEYVTGDTGLDNTKAVSEATRLIDTEGVFGIVGALASGISLQVAEGVTGVKQVPQISPSSTSPALTVADDNGYFFRTALSDAAQGVVLAELVTGEGVSNVGLMVVNNAYGTGLANVFKANYGGTVTEAVHAEEQPSYLAELNKIAANGATHLIAIGYPGQANVYLREAVENSLFNKFFFVDGTKSNELKDAVGAAVLSGSKGTAPGSGPETDAARAWDAAYLAEYGALPTRPFVKEAYDAAILLALAAAYAGSFDGPAVRDALTAVATTGGLIVIPSDASIKAGLDTAGKQNGVNYEGASSTVEWDGVGDITSGYVEIWQFGSDGIPVTVETKPFSVASSSVSSDSAP